MTRAALIDQYIKKALYVSFRAHISFWNPTIIVSHLREVVVRASE